MILSRKSFVLFAAILFAITGALAALHRFSPKEPIAERAQDRSAKDPAPEQSPQSLSPQAVGPIDRSVIAGGGGTSMGGSFRLDGTIGEVSASNEQTGGSLSLRGGFWNMIDGSTPTPTPTPSPTPTPTPTPTPIPNVVQFSSSNYNVQEDCTTVTIIVNRLGDTSGAASVDYNTSDVTATERKDYITALGRLQFTPGETSKSFAVLINEDSYVEGEETFNLNLSNPSGASLGGSAIASVSITDDAVEPATNPIDDPRNFVCQNYHDFLNRQPDSGGWDFWTNQTTSCGSPDPLVCRINVSASFFLSIEFQQTGYLVERSYKTAYGDRNGSSTFGGPHLLPVPFVRFAEFLSDTQKITQGVIVLQPGWEQQLENNKQGFFFEFVQRSSFVTALPTSITPAQFVDTLNQNAGNVLSASERTAAINLFGSASNTANPTARAQALRQVVEDEDLQNAEFNRAFVLMEYLGYLRRNPNDPQDTDYTGYDFWLTKLNQFNGNYLNAEMVKAFITSIEYRQRFAP
jgi:Calx-beta domain